MKVSVIIPTYNGKHKIINLLRSLEKQTFQAFEVVVLVDGSTDGTEAFLKSQIFQLPLKIYSQKNGGRAAARNAGAKKSKGELLIFFDDDIRLLPNTLEQHANHHLQNPHSALTGFTMLDEQFCTTEISKYRAFIEQHYWHQGYQNRKYLMDWQTMQITTQNFSIAKTLLLEHLGGFEEKLKDSEDFDLGLRILKAEIPFFFDEKLKVWHDDYVTFEQYLKRQAEYIIARQKLLELRPELFALHPSGFQMLAQAKSWRNSLKAFFRYNFFWKKVIVSIFWKKIIPQKIRYQLYDWLIYAHSRKSLLQYLQKKASKNEAFSETKTSLQ